MARQPVADNGGAVLAMFLDAAILATIAIRRWHTARHHNQQVEAARQTLTHLQAVYVQAAAVPLAALAQRRPPQRIIERHAQQIRQAVPSYADQILNDPAWSALATALSDAVAAGHQPERLIRQAADLGALNDARSPARVLTWRIHRLTQRPAPSPRAKAAQARSTVARGSAGTGPRPVDVPSSNASSAEYRRHR
jgi:hypothetical protein